MNLFNLTTKTINPSSFSYESKNKSNLVYSSYVKGRKVDGLQDLCSEVLGRYLFVIIVMFLVMNESRKKMTFFYLYSLFIWTFNEEALLLKDLWWHNFHSKKILYKIIYKVEWLWDLVLMFSLCVESCCRLDMGFVLVIVLLFSLLKLCSFYFCELILFLRLRFYFHLIDNLYQLCLLFIWCKILLTQFW